MRVRVCIKCREYIYIHNDNFISQKALKRFETIHTGHTMVTINESELANTCGFEKPLSEFYKERQGKYGVRSKCKSCFCAMTLEQKRTYRTTLHGVMKENEYRRSSRAKQVRQRYSKTEKYRNKEQHYRSSEKGRET